MSEFVPILIFAGFGILVIVAGYFSAQAAKKRREELFLLATRLGFDYFGEGVPGSAATSSGGFWSSLLSSVVTASPENQLIQNFHGFSPFGQGHSPDIKNLIVGRKGDRDWYLFDYSYKTTSSNGKTTTTTTHPVGVVAVRLPLSLPSLELSPETVFHRIGSKLGMGELTFELEEFNRRYFIQSSDARLAHDLLHPRAIDYLMAQPVRHWQMGGLYVVMTRSGYNSALETDRIMQEVDGFLDLVPDYVREDRGFTATWRSPLD